MNPATNANSYFDILQKLNMGGSGALLTNTDTQSMQGTITSEMSSLRNSLSSMPPMSQVIAAQSQVNNILKSEMDYLALQEKEIIQDVETGNRMMRLNDSNRKRYGHYIMIVMIWIGTAALVLLLVYLNRYLGVPFNFFFVIIITVAILWTLLTLRTMYIRDPTDFDKLHLAPPKMTPAKYSGPAASPSDGSGSGGSGSDCIGQQCCTYGMHYDLNQRKCVENDNVGQTMLGRLFSRDYFTNMTDVISQYPPVLPTNIFPMYMYDYACEGSQYCSYRDETRSNIPF